jgi:hypothetical protein
VVTVGTDEVQSRTFALKSMREGSEERGLPAAEIVPLVARALGKLTS